jgi:hypothetical protein
MTSRQQAPNRRSTGAAHGTLLLLALSAVDCYTSRGVLTTTAAVPARQVLQVPASGSRVTVQEGESHLFCPWGQYGFSVEQTTKPLLVFTPGKTAATSMLRVPSPAAAAAVSTTCCTGNSHWSAAVAAPVWAFLDSMATI